MAIKKTSSPLSSGAESLDQIGGKNELQRGGKVEKNFEAALAELAGEIEQTSANERAANPTRAAFQQIAAGANLDSSENAMQAVRESAEFLVSSRLGEEIRNSEQGKKIIEDLSNYISKDPMMYRKILSILQRLK